MMATDEERRGPVADAMGDDVYQPRSPDDDEVPDDAGVLDPEDTLEDRDADLYEAGYAPPDRPIAVEHTGTTAREQREGETLDERLREERPEAARAAGADRAGACAEEAAVHVVPDETDE